MRNSVAIKRTAQQVCYIITYTAAQQRFTPRDNSILSTNAHITGLTGEGNINRNGLSFANPDGQERNKFPM
jgi:hypothetical protein